MNEYKQYFCWCHLANAIFHWDRIFIYSTVTVYWSLSYTWLSWGLWKSYKAYKTFMAKVVFIMVNMVPQLNNSNELTDKEPTWIGVRSTLTDGERGSTRCLMFLMAGSGLTCLDAHILLSLDPIVLKYDFARIKHRTKSNTHTQNKTSDQSLRETKNIFFFYIFYHYSITLQSNEEGEIAHPCNMQAA